jgi:NAD+ kinase
MSVHNNLFIFIIINTNSYKSQYLNCLNKIKNLLENMKLNYQTSKSFPFNRQDLACLHKANLIIILGGDGTVLSSFAKLIDPSFPKIIPINFGTLGYIASVHEKNAIFLIRNYLKNKTNYYKLDSRNLLSVKCCDKQYLSLNEMVLIHREPVRPITINVCINDRITIKFVGDGILVSTSTGSTAYSLSIRGPILSPAIPAFILNPISPHSLNLKPIVLSSEDYLDISTDQEVLLAIDGNKIGYLKVTNIDCRLADKKLVLIKPKHETHYQILKNKLHWGG